MNLLIKNGKLVLKNGTKFADILIESGKIKKIEKNIENQGFEEIDASGKLVMAGGVDVHTHLNLDLGEFVACDDFYQGTKAAAYGGTTSICDHIGDLKKGSSLTDLTDHYHKLADGKAIIDYSFHGAMYEENEDRLSEMKDLKNEGIPSLKIYTTYGGKLEDDQMLRVLKMSKKLDMIVCVHCENDGMIKELRNEAKDKGNLSPKYHALTRPNESEAEAINRLIYLSKIAGYPHLYIVHTSTKEGLREIVRARKDGAKNLYCETCTQYLNLDKSYYEKDDGEKYLCSPPLRDKEDIEALWQGIENGDVDTIATDHCPFIYESEKKPYKNDFTKAPGGLPGVEERMEVILTEGLKRNIPLEKLTRLLSLNPAKIFRLYPKKGALKEGSDGDIAIFSNKSYTISEDNRHSSCDYTSYEGFKTSLKIDIVISRGEIILDSDGFYGKKGRGKFIKRKVSKDG